MFATHYLEITDLSRIETVENIHVTSIEHENDIIFLHKIKTGSAEKSYGIHVAKIAGLPTQVINAAEKRINELKFHKNIPSQRKLFKENVKKEKSHSKVLGLLKKIDPNSITPKKALDLIFKLKDIEN